MERGKQRLVAKDYPRAILEFRNAAQAAPRDAESHYQLGLAYLGAQDIQSALVSFRQATEINAAHSGAQIKLAELLTISPDKRLLNDAVQRMEAVLSSDPNYADALSTLAYAKLGLGEIQDAEKHLAEALTKAPANLKASFGLALLKVAQKQYADAETILRRATEQTPLTATPFIVLGEFYLSRKQLSDAKQQFNRALDIEKDNAPALFYLARLQFNAGETNAADNTYKKVSALKDKKYRTVYATFLSQTGKPEHAVRELERLAAVEPEDRLMRRQLISAYLMTGKTADADRVLNIALKKNPKDTDALLERAKMYLVAGKYTEAHSSLNQIVTYEPGSAQAHYLFARVHEQRGNTRSQRQELTEALRLNPGWLAVRIELARLLIASNAAKSALDLMNETPAWQKQTVPAIAQRNWALLATGNRDQMRKGVAEGAMIGKSADLLLQDAVLKLDQRDFGGTRASIEEILKNYPEETRALDVLVRVDALQDQSARALRRIREHAAAHPKSARVQQYLGASLQRTGAMAEARSAFQAAKSADKTFWAADVSTAALDVTENKFQAAREILTPLLSHPNAGSQARSLLAIAEEKSGNGAAALEHYRKLAEDQPDNAFALNQLAYLLVEQANSPDEALKIAERAKELAPDNATVDDTLGWILYKKGLYSRAVQHLENSVKRQANATRHAHLAIAYAARGESSRGLEQLQAAIKLNPNAPEIAAAQKLLAVGR